MARNKAARTHRDGRVAPVEAFVDEAIAIVGIGCRFPGGADGSQRFWQLLRGGVDAISEIPADRWSVDAYYHPDPGVAGASYSKWGGFLNGIDLFDPEAFGISPREARVMDPQQRLVLEVCRAAFDDAGRSPAQLAGSNTGVFLGVSTGDYAQLQLDPVSEGEPNPHTATGIALSIIANRVSYCFDLTGPSMIVDTACSSSLVATHLACTSLRRGDCDLALAGGVNLVLVPENFIAFCNMGMLSPDGRCKAFDASANGFVRGEGAGAVLLKPYAQARADGDRIYALILNTGVNQDGKTNGLQVPDGSAQAALLERTYRQAGLDPADLNYVEAHGTGTAVGDPIEAAALGSVISSGGPPAEPCRIGSVKSNIGHLESAAGIAGLIKTALVLHHGWIPPSLHFETPNPAIDFAGLGLKVQTELEPLHGNGKPALAGVNSFGFGGTNSHAVLAQVQRNPSVRARRQAPRHPVLLPLSARTPDRLRILAGSYLEHLTTLSDTDLPAVAYNASLRRDHLEYRLCLAGRTRGELAEHLHAYLDDTPSPGLVTGRAVPGEAPKLGFVCSGQGPQWWAMGRQLLASEPVVRRVMRRCDAILRELGGWSLEAELAADEASSNLRDTAFAQPAICALQLALAALWASWGVRPDFVVGHSVGEIAAACIAGAISQKSAMTIAFHRGRLMSAHPGGRMLALGLDQDAARELCRVYSEREALVAAVNSPGSVVLAGDPDALAEIAERCELDGVFNRFLQVEYAFHSPWMDPVRRPLLEALATMRFRRPRIPLVSSVTGTWLERPLDAEYWWQNIRQPVRFQPAVEALIGRGCDLVLEIGPHPVLLPAVAATARAMNTSCRVVASLRRGEEESLAMTIARGALHCAGLPLDWQRLYPKGGCTVSLPGFPWNRSSFWNESPASQATRIPDGSHPLLGLPAASHLPAWEGTIDTQRLPFLEQHQLQGRPLFPAAAFIETALSAGQCAFGHGRPVLDDIEFKRALFLPDPPARLGLLTEVDEDAREVHLSSWEAGTVGKSTLHCRARIGSEDADITESASHFDPAEVIARLPHAYEGSLVYELSEETELHYGPDFQGVVRFWKSDDEVLAEIVASEAVAADAGRYLFHPALLDSCLQTLSLNRPLESWHTSQITFVPVRADQVRFFRSPEGSRLWAHAVKRRDTLRNHLGDLQVYDELGRSVMAIFGIESTGLEADRPGSRRSVDEWLYRLAWIPVENESRAGRHTDFAPSMAALKVAAAETSDLTGADITRRQAAVASAALTELVAAGFTRALTELGFADLAGQTLSLAELAARLDVAPHRCQVLAAGLRLLEDHGWTERAELGWRVPTALPSPVDPILLARQALAQHPALFAEVSLSFRAVDQLSAYLRGAALGAEILAPGGATGFLEQLWRDAPTFELRNQRASDAVHSLLEHLPRGVIARILVVGADSGGVVARLVDRLPPAGSCVVTACDPARLATVSTLVRDDNAFRVERLDLAQDPLEQGFDPHDFDVVIVADAVRCAPDPAAALSALGQLLMSEGVLILLDAGHGPPWLDLVLAMGSPWDEPSPPISDIASLLGNRFVDVLELGDSPRSAGGTVWLARNPRRDLGQLSPHSNPASAEPDGSERWLLVRDRSGVAERLAARLAEQGVSCLTVAPEADMAEAFATGPVTTVVHLCSLDCSTSATITLETILNDELLTVHSVIELMRGLAETPQPVRTRFCFVTRGARHVEGDHELVALAQAPLLGTVTSAALEYSNLPFKMVDLDPADTPDVQVGQLLGLLRSNDSEEESVFRAGRCFVPRLRRTTLSEVPTSERIPARPARSPPERFRLRFPRSRRLEKLSFCQVEAEKPGPGEVEVEVAAAALNFRDVLKALGLYPSDGDDYLLLGDECAGTVRAVGPGVTQYRPGDEVIAMAPTSFASHVIASEDLIMPKPAELSFTEAVTLPVAFLTAYYCLDHVARLAPGERVLIHAAAGGVGQAAVQVALARGAEVFASASAGKRDLLRLLGVEHVLDSRSLDFADDIRELTEGAGVDVILNSLAGEAIAKGISILAPYGRFVEIGKRDIYEDRKVGLRGFRNNASFHAVDLSRLMVDKPGLVRQLQLELGDALDRGTIRPLPHRVVPASRIAEAFRTMLRGSHAGKIVISLCDPNLRIEPLPARSGQIHADASYLITGGCGGFGLEIGRMLLRGGARHLALLGRSGAASPQAQAALEEFAAVEGAEVRVLQADVADPDQLATALGEIRATMPPLRGVVHAAMVLDDRPLEEIDHDSVRRVMAPKVDGLWNLHSLTESDELDFLFLTSSIASLLGNGWQANYAAANAFLDQFVHYRRGLGLPASAINWGPLAEAGVVANNPELARRLDRLGLRGLNTHMALSILKSFLARDLPLLAAFWIDPPSWLGRLGNRPIPGKFKELLEGVDLDSGSDAHSQHLLAALAVAPDDARLELVTAFLCLQLGKILGMSADRIDREVPLQSIGLDSLMAVELHQRLERELGVAIPSTELARSPSADGLSAFLLGTLAAARITESLPVEAVS